MLTVAQIVTQARRLLNDPSAQGRWSDASLISFTDEAQQLLTRDVEFPQSRLTAPTIVNQQEYATPDLLNVYRVYLAGQLLVPTTKQILEGHQTQEYDQGLDSGIMQPGIQTPGSGGPPGTQGSFTPAWNIQSPEAYPVANAWGSPAPDAQPWFTGQRPRYYFDGGVIGFVPAPSSIVTMCIDCLRVPDPLANLIDITIFPYNFRTAMVWKVVEFAKFADNDQTASEQRMYASQMYEKEMRKLRTTYKFYAGDAPRMPKMFTNRTLYQKGNVRNCPPGFNYP